MCVSVFVRVAGVADSQNKCSAIYRANERNALVSEFHSKELLDGFNTLLVCSNIESYCVSTRLVQVLFPRS